MTTQPKLQKSVHVPTRDGQLTITPMRTVRLNHCSYVQDTTPCVGVPQGQHKHMMIHCPIWGETCHVSQVLWLQIDTLSSLGRLEELTIRHNPILRQVLLRTYICFCLPKLKVGHKTPQSHIRTTATLLVLLQCWTERLLHVYPAPSPGSNCVCTLPFTCAFL